MEDAILLVKDLAEFVSQTEEKMLIYMFLIRCEFKNPIRCFSKKGYISNFAICNGENSRYASSIQFESSNTFLLKTLCMNTL